MAELALASALKLLNVSTTNTGLILLLVAIFAPVLWMFVRRRHGFLRSRRAAPAHTGDGRSNPREIVPINTLRRF